MIHNYFSFQITCLSKYSITQVVNEGLSISFQYYMAENKCVILKTYRNTRSLLDFSFKYRSSGSPREILQGGTRLLWSHDDRRRIWGPIKPLGNLQLEIISLTEFYIFFFLNQSLTSMAKAIWPFRLFTDPSWALRARDRCIDVSAVPPLFIGPVSPHHSRFLHWQWSTQIYNIKKVVLKRNYISHMS